ncbi:hypothetical protein LJC49_11110 [Ruminococcaceae bacterium OttesenSCG-928-I18]|nr:hypothetical protein [Ruminococcaceae bacterium OttesenSCG-928-I18]
MNKPDRHIQQDTEPEITSPTIELEKQAVFQIGDTTIIATAYYQDEGDSCADRLLRVLLEEAEKQ